MLHVWIGGMFIPDSTGPEVLAVLEDFEQHANWYPEVLESKRIDQKGGTLKGSHQIIRQKVLTAVLNLEYDVTFRQESPTQWSVRSIATRIAEVSNPDETHRDRVSGWQRQWVLVEAQHLLAGRGGGGRGAGRVSVALFVPRHSSGTRVDDQPDHSVATRRVADLVDAGDSARRQGPARLVSRRRRPWAVRPPPLFRPAGRPCVGGTSDA